MACTITIPTRMLGFNYDIELSHWHDKLDGFRLFEDGSRIPLDGGLGFGLSLLGKNEQIQNWINQIPDSYYLLTSQFPEYQYQMLWLAANSRNAAQLLESRNLLLVFICDKYPTDNTEALRVCQTGQREILSTLGFSSSKSALKFIDKLTLEYHRAGEISQVKKQLDNSFCRYKVFKHYQSVNYAALALDHSHPFLTGTRLGHAVATQPRNGKRNLVTYLSDTLSLGIAIGVEDPLSAVARLTTFEQLQELHDEWVERQLTQRFERLKPVNPEEPYKSYLLETDNIKQISDYNDLCNEAKVQRHCIEVYHNRISLGHYVAFRMEKPQRMTIGIEINNKRAFPFEVQQIAGFRNEIPSEETRSEVYRWFDLCKKNAQPQRNSSYS